MALQANGIGIETREISIIPVSPTQRERTSAIEKKAKVFLAEDIRLYIDSPFKIYTIAQATITSAVSAFNQSSVLANGQTDIVLGPALGCRLSMKEADAEKDGNLNVVFYQPVPGIKLSELKNFLVEGNYASGPYTGFDYGTPEATNVANAIEAQAVVIMNSKYRTLVKTHLLCLTITNYYIAAIVEYFNDFLTHNEGKVITYNLADQIEITGIIDHKTGEPKIKFQPGVCAKLTVKQDNITEE